MRSHLPAQQQKLARLQRHRTFATVRQTSLSPTCQVKTVEQLQDPAHIGAKCKKQAVVQEVPNYPLDTYMRLPVEQYYELDPHMIKPLGNNRFQLLVPRIQIFNVWLEPVVEVQVHQQGNEVVIEAVHCQLKGSDLITNMQLDRKFVMNFRTVLTWTLPLTLQTTLQLPAAAQPLSTGNGSIGNGSRIASNDAAWQVNGAANGASQAAGTPSSSSLTGVPAGKVSESTIYADLDLNVWCEVIPPFTLLPLESVLQPTANAVLAGLTRTLLPVFVRKLASDYERWAREDSYRQRRAALTKAAHAGIKEDSTAAAAAAVPR